MKKDPSLIPAGQYCYSIVKIAEGEVLSDDIDRFGKDLREFSYREGYKEVLCPYWQHTDYGTVRCDYLEVEVVDEWEKGAHDKVRKHFGVSDVYERTRAKGSWDLSDEMKICDVNMDDEDEDDCG